MQYLKLKQAFNDFTLFSLNEIRQLEPGFHRRRLHEWQKKGYIRKIIQEFYIFSDIPLNENVLNKIANRIYMPSYISLEAALSYYHLIPESTYAVTSVSTRRTYTFHTALGEFIYRTIKPDLYFGYMIAQTEGRAFKIAEPEKAILDFLYLKPHLKEVSDFESLRLNDEVFFQRINLSKLDLYSLNYQNKALIKRAKSLVDYMLAQKDGSSDA